MLLLSLGCLADTKKSSKSNNVLICC